MAKHRKKKTLKSTYGWFKMKQMNSTKRRRQ